MGLYVNPVWAKDFPDPHAIAWRGRFYAFATETAAVGRGFQALESRDLVRWEPRGMVFTPPWSGEHYWAPEVTARRGVFHLTYSALNPRTRRHDIGIATASAPLGPYTDRAILVRGDDNKVGVIDATICTDRGVSWLVYSEEEPRRIVARRLSADWLSTVGETVEIVRPDREWERGVTEAPTLVRRGGKLHLLYSGGWFESRKGDSSYCVAHASAPGMAGPWEKTGPILRGDGEKVFGPGHQTLVSLRSGEDWLLYHAWDDQKEPRYGSNPLGRTLRLDRLTWKDGRPGVDGPSLGERPAPRV